jgi:hypothetical protein
MTEHSEELVDVETILRRRGAEVESMFRLTQMVNAGLDRQVLAIVLELLEHGIHPESIADGKFFLFCCLFCCYLCHCSSHSRTATAPLTNDVPTHSLHMILYHAFSLP